MYKPTQETPLKKKKLSLGSCLEITLKNDHEQKVELSNLSSYFDDIMTHYTTDNRSNCIVIQENISEEQSSSGRKLE